MVKFILLIAVLLVFGKVYSQSWEWLQHYESIQTTNSTDIDICNDSLVINSGTCYESFFCNGQIYPVYNNVNGSKDAWISASGKNGNANSF